jgi:hypothetical protein
MDPALLGTKTWLEEQRLTADTIDKLFTHGFTSAQLLGSLQEKDT